MIAGVERTSCYEKFLPEKFFCRRNSLPPISLPVKKTLEIKITAAICSNLILPYNLLNFNKKIKKIQYFLLKCLYLNKYNAKKRKNQEKDGIYLQSIFCIKWKILTRSLYYKWK